MGIFDDIWGGFKDALGSKDTYSSLLNAGLNAVREYNAPSQFAPLPYGNTKEGFLAQQAFNEKELAQRLLIAQMNAQSGSAGAGAAIQAAKIQQATALKQLREKAIADALAAELDQQKTNIQARLQGEEGLLKAKQKEATEGQAGYQNAADILSRFRAG